MRCRNIFDASRQAQANANLTGKPWRYFTDPSGYAHCEQCPPDRTEDLTTWAGVQFNVVQPKGEADAKLLESPAPGVPPSV